MLMAESGNSIGPRPSPTTDATPVAPGEGRTAFLFFLHGFLLLFSYQVVKALREAFMLTKFSAEVRAYARSRDVE